ncbi:MAG: hypothetical protein Q9211_006007 [Gyalolechia sp. 1 TL-2023]
MAIPTRPAAIATPAAANVICPSIAGDAGAAPSATAADTAALILADADDKEADADDKEVDTDDKEADTAEGNALSQNSWAGVGIDVNQSGLEDAWASEARNSSGLAIAIARALVGMPVATAL